MLALLVLALASCAAPVLQEGERASSAFEAVPAREAIPRAPRPFPGGDEYELEGEAVWRVRAGQRVQLRCTTPEGTGAARALASRPAGSIFLAAERGLFCTSPEVDALDEVRRIDGAPPGAPVGVAFGDADRLWLATEDAFGPIDPRQGFGRTLSADDGPPPGPYRALLPAKDGSLLLKTDAGVFRYRPDQGAPPSVRIVAVEGAPFEPGRTVDTGPDGALELELEGAGSGGASFRYRLVGNHLWRPLEAPRARIDGLEPGEQGIEVVALDRDLRRSGAVLVRARVPVPWYFRTKVLLASAAGALALLFALALVSAWRAGGGLARTSRALLSSLLAFLVGMQLLGGVVPHARSWPIVGFAMYTDVYRAWGYAYQLDFHAVRRDGGRVLVRPWDAGYGQFEWHRDLSDVVFGGEDAQRAWLARWNERYGPGAPFKGFVVQDARQRLTPDGPVPVAPVVYGVFPAEDADAPR